MPAYLTEPIARLLPDTVTVSLEGVLEIASRPLPALARQYGTPLYIFDRTTTLKACASYRQAFQKYYSASPVQILYASKELPRSRTNGPKRRKRPCELARQAEMSSGRHPNPQASARPAKSRSKGRLPDESSGAGGPSWMPKAKMKTPRGSTVAARRAAKILVRRIALGCIERC